MSDLFAPAFFFIIIFLAGPDLQFPEEENKGPTLKFNCT